MTTIIGLIVLVVVATIIATPAAFFGMLFLGNLGINLSFWAVLPGAIALRCVSTNLLNTSNKGK